MNYLIVTLLLFGLLTGCSPSSDEGQKKPVATTAKTTPVVPSGSWIAPAREVILDSFEVGADAYVRALMVEKEDNTLWVGTSVGVLEIGLDKLDVRNTLTRAQGLANEYVFAIGRDREGYKWFGTNAGGASRYKDGTWKTYFPMHGLADYWVYSFAQHPDGGLWIGTWAGVNRMDLVTGRFDTFVKELVNEWVYAIVVDSRNRTWFGTEGGISRLDGHEWRSWTHKDGLGGENLEESPV
ncbi:MAG TPA: hypothetical protein HPQ00_16455, partial [Magnetococcales bacterium]|nr:hypothetical protein [Magnetococcales bacterium]